MLSHLASSHFASTSRPLFAEREPAGIGIGVAALRVLEGGAWARALDDEGTLAVVDVEVGWCEFDPNTIEPEVDAEDAEEPTALLSETPESGEVAPENGDETPACEAVQDEVRGALGDVMVSPT